MCLHLIKQFIQVKSIKNMEHVKMWLVRRQRALL